MCFGLNEPFDSSLPLPLAHKQTNHLRTRGLHPLSLITAYFFVPNIIRDIPRRRDAPAAEAALVQEPAWPQGQCRSNERRRGSVPSASHLTSSAVGHGLPSAAARYRCPRKRQSHESLCAIRAERPSAYSAWLPPQLPPISCSKSSRPSSCALPCSSIIDEAILQGRSARPQHVPFRHATAPPGVTAQDTRPSSQLVGPAHQTQQGEVGRQSCGGSRSDRVRS